MASIISIEQKKTFKYIYLTYKWDPYRYYRSGQSVPGSNGNAGVLQTRQISRNGSSTSDAVLRNDHDTPFLRRLRLCRRYIQYILNRDNKAKQAL